MIKFAVCLVQYGILLVAFQAVLSAWVEEPPSPGKLYYGIIST